MFFCLTEAMSIKACQTLIRLWVHSDVCPERTADQNHCPMKSTFRYSGTGLLLVNSQSGCQIQALFQKPVWPTTTVTYIHGSADSLMRKTSGSDYSCFVFVCFFQYFLFIVFNSGSFLLKWMEFFKCDHIFSLSAVANVFCFYIYSTCPASKVLVVTIFYLKLQSWYW